MDVPVLPIYGAAGIGKTTLAQLVFDDGDVVRYFGLRIWVSLCEGCDIRRAMKETVEAITRSKYSLLSLHILQHRLGELLRMNRFLLVLDNLWAEDRRFWEIFWVPLLAGESEKEKECWALLQGRTFPQGDSEEDKGLVEIGTKIAEKCKGSLLAAKSLSDLLHDSKAEEEWMIRLSEMPVLEKDQNGVLPSLQISYHHSPFHLKRCFAYCFLFPNGCAFEKDEVVRLWMAEDLIERDGRRRLEVTGAEWVRYATLFHLDQNPLAFEKLYEYENLRTLKLCREIRVPLKQVPKELFLKLSGLRVLDLSNSEVKELPDFVGDLIHLSLRLASVLSYHHPRMCEFPAIKSEGLHVCAPDTRLNIQRLKLQVLWTSVLANG
uniref:NB-ARC domain-containing protein n=1 Tax=Ananas comosus var. bracteatus TaxID=296719 RepID=A0A6V7PE65_ANACO|nr:unnamed protein product [Ananas comosus var. bracteatus]